MIDLIFSDSRSLLRVSYRESFDAYIFLGILGIFSIEFYAPFGESRIIRKFRIPGHFGTLLIYYSRGPAEGNNTILSQLQQTCTLKKVRLVKQMLPQSRSPKSKPFLALLKGQHIHTGIVLTLTLMSITPCFFLCDVSWLFCP